MAYTRDSFKQKRKIKDIIGSLFIVGPVYDFFKTFFSSLLFFFILNFYFIPKMFLSLQKKLRLPRAFIKMQEQSYLKTCRHIVNSFSKKSGSISRWQLIHFAFKNMGSKKTRTIVTVGGMAIGIGATVLLLSLGYGVEELVKSRVASLNEVKQATVFTSDQLQKPLNDEAIKTLSSIENVELVVPLVSVVGRVDYQGSAVDVVVYSSPDSYLKNSDISLSYGEFYKSDDSWKAVYANPDVANFLKKESNKDNQETQGLVVPSGKVEEKDSNETSVVVPRNDAKNNAKKDIAYVKSTPAVLGVSDSDENKSTDTTTKPSSSGSEGLNLNNVSGQAKNLIRDLQNKGFDDKSLKELIPEITGPTQVTSLEINVLDSVAVKQAVVTESFLNTIGFNPDNYKKALGTQFTLQMTLIGDLIPALNDKKILSKKTTYNIVGIIPGNSAYIYVPLVDIKSLGVVNYTQAKVVANSDLAVPHIRERIEGFGFQTQSVQDTLSKIENLFNGLRIALLFLGILALSVASLGMFNTLTVSLLERTHEVGLLKAMGMKSEEVKELFLAESLILGFFGGVAGLLFGFVVGKLIDLGLSVFSVSAGIGYLSITYIPFALVVFVLSLSFFIGVLTGMYPSKRATKISALDALRYE